MLLFPKHRLSRLTVAGLAVAACAGSAAGAASADSIAYIKGGDVWLTTADAARQFQVTGTGGYVGVAQADDGTLLATTGSGLLQRLDRYGQALSTISTPVSQPTNGGSTVFVGPLDADISPDGRTAGYGFIKMGTYRYPDGTVDADMYDGHGFTKSDTATGFLDQGYKYASDWSAPEFIDNSTVLVSNGPGWPSSPFAIETLGSGDPRSWFNDPDNPHPMDATISRNKRFVAAVHGPDRLSLYVYRIGDGVLRTATINRCMIYSDPAGFRYESPTLSGDGKVLAWGSGKGLDIAPLGDATSSCPDAQNGGEYLPGASSPDWGPADVPASRPADKPLPGTTSGGSGGGASTPANPAPAPARVTPTPQRPASLLPKPAGASDGGAELGVRVASARLAAALRKGLVVTITAPKGGAVRVTASKATKKLGSGRATAKAGRPATVRIRFTAAAHRALAHARRATLTLTITAPGVPVTRAAVTIKR